MSNLKQLNQKYGKGSVMMLSDKQKKYDVISTGSIALDIETGIGGLPLGRVIEIFGEESCGKTSLMLSIIAEAQKKGIKCAFIDTEYAIDPVYTEKLGVDLSKVLYAQPENGEDVFQLTQDLTESGEYGLIMIDSVTSITTKAMIQKDFDQATMSELARLMSKGIRKLVRILDKNKTMLVFSNQMRTVIGGAFSYRESTGGKALKFYSSMRIQLSNSAKDKEIKEKDKIIGKRIVAFIKKNKVSSPFGKATIELVFEEGVSKTRELIKYGIELGILKKSGSFYTIGEKKVHGVNKCIEAMKDNEKIKNKIIEKIKEKYYEVK